MAKDVNDKQNKYRSVEDSIRDILTGKKQDMTVANTDTSDDITSSDVDDSNMHPRMKDHPSVHAGIGDDDSDHHMVRAIRGQYKNKIIDNA